MWLSLSPEEKGIYIARNEENKRKYELDLAEYQKPSEPTLRRSERIKNRINAKHISSRKPPKLLKKNSKKAKSKGKYH